MKPMPLEDVNGSVLKHTIKFTETPLFSFLQNNIEYIQVLAHVAIFFQSWKIFREADGSNISIVAYIIRLAMASLWFTYAVYKGNVVGKFGELLEVFGIVLVLALVVYYRDPLNKRLDYPDKIMLEKDPNAIIKKYAPDTYGEDNVAYVLINDPIMHVKDM